MRRGIAAVVAGLLSASCGAVDNLTEEAVEQGIEAETGGDVELDVDADGGGGSIVVDGAGGTQSFTAGSSIPEELTLPLHEGYEVVGSGTAEADAGSYLSVNVRYPASSVTSLVTFYSGYFEDATDISAFESSAGGVQSWTWAATDGSTQVVISLASGDTMADVLLIETTGTP